MIVIKIYIVRRQISKAYPGHASKPHLCCSSSVGAGRRGAGKRAREAGIHNGHHAQPRPNCQPSQQDSAAHVQDSTRCLSPPHPLHQASDHQSSPQPSQTQSPLRDMPKTPGDLDCKYKV